MKKPAATLDEIRGQLQDNGLWTPHVEAAWNVLVQAVDEIPAPTKNTGPGVLPAPTELRDFPQGLALYADGACRGNPGPGAWACVAQNSAGEVVFESAGFDSSTTNNRMEIQGAIQAIMLLEDHLMAHPFADPTPVLFLTDSKYVVEGMNQWIEGWKARGWKKADGKAPENLDLWQELDLLKAKHPKLKAAWVKGHNGHPQNEFCDSKANALLDAEGF